MQPAEAIDSGGDIYNILYCSHATALMGEAELEKIVKSSQLNNPARGVTGLLAFGGGMFLQWLEGPRDEVEALMTVLKSDPRHETIVRLQVLSDLSERLYPRWAMQFAEPNEIREILIDCQRRAKDKRQATLIDLMMKLLATDQQPKIGF